MTTAAHTSRVARPATAASAAAAATIAVSTGSDTASSSTSTYRDDSSATMSGASEGSPAASDVSEVSRGNASASDSSLSYLDYDPYEEDGYFVREHAQGESPRVTVADIAAAKAAGKTPRKRDLAGVDSWEEDASTAAMRKLRNDTIRTSRVRMTRSDEGFIHQMVDALTDPESFGSRGDWIQHAKCRDIDPDALFVHGSAQREAAAICRHCPVVLQCRADALDNRVEFGVWGGLTERQRRALLKAHPEVTSWAAFYAGKVRPIHRQQQQRRTHTV